MAVGREQRRARGPAIFRMCLVLILHGALSSGDCAPNPGTRALRINNQLYNIAVAVFFFIFSSSSPNAPDNKTIITMIIKISSIFWKNEREKCASDNTMCAPENPNRSRPCKPAKN